MQYSALHNRTWKTPTVQKPCRNRAAMAYKTKKPWNLSISRHFLVRWKGLEPPAYWFVVSHSIQLSYQRIRSVRNMMYFTTHLRLCQPFFEIIFESSQKEHLFVVSPTIFQKFCFVFCTHFAVSSCISARFLRPAAALHWERNAHPPQDHPGKPLQTHRTGTFYDFSCIVFIILVL